MQMDKVTFTITRPDAGKRVDIFLTQMLSGFSRSQIQKLISDEKVLVKGTGISKNTRLSENDVVEVFEPSVAHSSHIKPQDVSFSILYEDEYLVAVNKPAGVVVHPGNGNHDGTLVNGLVKKISSLSDGFNPERPGIVHRLDKETSGVLIVAKTNQSHAAMAALFQNREIEKKYVGFCIGTPSEFSGIIDLPLDRSRHDPLKRAPSSHGKSSITEYQVIQTKGGISAISFMPRTGRTHQIRVHASAKGFPIVGDKLYGGGNDRILRINPLDRVFAYSILKCFQRHALHALSISFIHPFLTKRVEITAPVPDDFEEASFRFGSTQLFRV